MKTKRKAKAKKTKPVECWATTTADGEACDFGFSSKIEAAREAAFCDSVWLDDAPHRVVLMREVRR